MGGLIDERSLTSLFVAAIVRDGVRAVLSRFASNFRADLPWRPHAMAAFVSVCFICDQHGPVRTPSEQFVALGTWTRTVERHAVDSASSSSMVHRRGRSAPIPSDRRTRIYQKPTDSPGVSGCRHRREQWKQWRKTGSSKQKLKEQANGIKKESKEQADCSNCEGVEEQANSGSDKIGRSRVEGSC